MGGGDDGHLGFFLLLLLFFFYSFSREEPDCLAAPSGLGAGACECGPGLLVMPGFSHRPYFPRRILSIQYIHTSSIVEREFVDA